MDRRDCSRGERLLARWKSRRARLSQSERMFAALKGNGGNVRYVQLPLEPHGYIAKESRRHVIWEMVNWLDTHVKQPKKSMSQ